MWTRAIEAVTVGVGGSSSVVRIFLSVTLLVAFFSQPAWATPSDAFLDAPIAEFKAHDELFKLCMILNRPCGKELAFHFEPQEYPEMNLQHTSARKVLDEITRRYSGHHWVIQNDILILEPEKRIGKDLLATRLGYVSVHGSSSHRAALAVFNQARINVATIYVGPLII